MNYNSGLSSVRTMRYLSTCAPLKSRTGTGRLRLGRVVPLSTLGGGEAFLLLR